jgi:hypothetical protein|tara:strand:- start:4121 stop:4630 length:510 start_codon:yes stop_codon:yes gene_type:complete
MALIDTLTGKTPAETYTKLIQVNDDNILMDGIGTEVSPIMKSGAVITGSLEIQGTLTRNGVEIGSSTDSFWGSTSAGDIKRQTGNVQIATGNSQDPEAKLQVNSDSTEEDFFIIKKETTSGGSTTYKDIFKVNNDGVVVLSNNDTEPDAVNGGMYYNSATKEYYLGVDD